MPTAPPRADQSAAAWDIEFTRLARDVSGRTRSTLQDIAQILPDLGLSCEVLTRPTPRGLSTYVSVIGQRGLLCIFDFTLIDGMLTEGRQGAALEVSLLDAEGDVAVEFSSARCGPGLGFGRVAVDIVAAAATELNPAILLSTMTTHFLGAVRRPIAATRHSSP